MTTPIRSLEEVATKARGKKIKLSVAGGNAPTVIEAIGKAVREEVVEAILVGDKEGIIELAKEHSIDPHSFEIIDEQDVTKVPAKAVDLIRNGEAQMLMKGMVNSADYMRAILNKKAGLFSPGEVLTHVTVCEVPTYPKLMIVSDVAVLIEPDLSEKIKMLEYCIQVANALGIENPKTAIISCVEKPSYKIDSTIDGVLLKKLAAREQLKGAIIDGPLAMDLAISKRSAEEKNYHSEVAGDADILIFPNITAANVFFKTLTNLAHGRIAALVVGASVPCILTSRADTEESKFMSIALGALLV
ncbi:phosphate butyryltransferase [bacterium]|nr:phosphate butyryltransferase [bacterium]